jgi:hypothetical protein
MATLATFGHLDYLGIWLVGCIKVAETVKMVRDGQDGQDGHERY